MPCWCPRARMVYPLSCPSVVGLLLFCDDLDLNAVSKETFVSFPTSPRPDVSTGYPGGSVLLYPAGVRSAEHDSFGCPTVQRALPPVRVRTPARCGSTPW